MMASEYIINVTEADFEYEVLAFSQQIPVIVDFWAEWCAPCRMLGPVLERLAQEGQGSFRLAKLNVDENPNLALRYGVHSIPAVKAFREGKMVAEFSGVQPEPRLREFLRSLAPSKNDLAIEKGFSLLSMRHATQSELTFRSVLEEAPENSAAKLGLAKSLLMQGNGNESYEILRRIPASREYQAAQTLLPLAKDLARLENNQADVELDPLDPAFRRALMLVRRGNIEAAMDGLLDILRENKHYKDGQARLMMVALLELLGEDNPTARQYRTELASVLF
jgi:putative thioredoxin